MTREMMKRIRRAKEESSLLVRYANPKSKCKPTEEQVLSILYHHIPCCGAIRPIIKKFTVYNFSRNSLLKSAYFIVELDNGKSYKISAYENLKGRTPEQKEADKTATFPSGLFTIFHDEIVTNTTEATETGEKTTKTSGEPSEGETEKKLNSICTDCTRLKNGCEGRTRLYVCSYRDKEKIFEKNLKKGLTNTNQYAII